MDSQIDLSLYQALLKLSREQSLTSDERNRRGAILILIAGCDDMLEINT
jgi:hypothetical protein